MLMLTLIYNVVIYYINGFALLFIDFYLLNPQSKKTILIIFYIHETSDR